MEYRECQFIESTPALYEGSMDRPAGKFLAFRVYTGIGINGDLWEFDASANIWTWINGPGISDLPAVYALKEYFFQ